MHCSWLDFVRRKLPSLNEETLREYAAHKAKLSWGKDLDHPNASLTISTPKEILEQNFSSLDQTKLADIPINMLVQLQTQTYFSNSMLQALEQAQQVWEKLSEQERFDNIYLAQRYQLINSILKQKYYSSSHTNWRDLSSTELQEIDAHIIKTIRNI